MEKDQKMEHFRKKTLLFMLSFFYLCGVTSAQASKAAQKKVPTSGNGTSKPSKNEIIDWIFTKIRENSTTGVVNSNVTIKIHVSADNELTEVYQATAYGGSSSGKVVITADNICSASYIPANDNTGPESILISLKNAVNLTVTDTEGRSQTFSDVSIRLYLNKESDANIYTRMIKALNDLGTYNCPKAKEIY